MTTRAGPYYRCRLPFGAYARVDISEIPSEYLEWVLTILDERDRGGMLRRGITEELARRRERGW